MAQILLLNTNDRNDSTFVIFLICYNLVILSVSNISDFTENPYLSLRHHFGSVEVLRVLKVNKWESRKIQFGGVPIKLKNSCNI